MQFTSAIVASILAFTSSAIPLAARDASTGAQGTFTLISIRSGSPVHLLSVAANDYNFWLNKPTESYCPEQVENCPPGNLTAFGAGYGGLSMDVEVPGGQLAFVGPDGKLSWTVPHSGAIPAGSVTQGFVYTPPASEGQVGELTLENSNGFYACPCDQEDGTVAYDISAAVNGTTVPENCYGIALGATPYTKGAAAWEYV